MSDDGRFLALGAIGLLAAGAAARGSRGIVRSGCRSSRPWYATLRWPSSEGVHHQKAVSFHEDRSAAIAFLMREFSDFPKSDTNKFLRSLEKDDRVFKEDVVEAWVGEVVPGESFGF